MSAGMTVPAREGALPSASRRQQLRGSAWGVALSLALVVELVVFSTINRNFFGGGVGMLSQIQLFIPTGVIALGLSVVVLTGRIDLSVGSTASLASVLAGVLAQQTNVVFAVIVPVLVGVLIGVVNGVLITWLRLDSLLVTLATQFIIGSLAFATAGANPPYDFPVAFRALGLGSMAGVPISLLIFLVCGLVLMLVIGRTRFGRHVVLSGANEPAALYSGLPVRSTVIVAFTTSSAAAALGGVLIAAYYNAGRPADGTALLVPALTCVVLGGVDVFGGKGRIGDVILAALFLGYLGQGLLNSGVSSLSVLMITGLLLAVALVLKTIAEGRGAAEVARRLQQRLAPPKRPSRGPGPAPDN